MTEHGPMQPNRIRVMIVDDHPIVRDGLINMLLAFDDMELVGEVESGREALALCQRLRCDVILMDMVMPDMDGAATTRLILEQHPEAKIVVLTSFPEEDLVKQALEAGAVGYLLKNAPIDTLANAIRSAHAGQPTLAPEATQALIQAATQPSEPGYDLTPREQEVLALIVKGLSNPEIAKRLVIGLSTVKYHVSSIFSKLGVTSRAEAIALAWQHELVTGRRQNLSD